LRVVATIWRCRTTGSGNISSIRVETWRTEHECELGLDLDLPAMPCLLADIRSEITALLLPGPVLEVAQLLLSELVTNSMRHAGLGPDDRIRVRAEAGLGRLRVDVFDGGRAHKPPLAGGIRPNPGARSGWGLYLVDTLATRWGNGVGWHWFELDIDEPPA
jgi:anti-sigma regulatory factor (Ser/Thr protein kinase)